MDLLIVVAPVYNESGNIGAFLDKLARLQTDQPLGGVLLVDDGSTDDTVEKIRQRAASFPVPLRLVKLSRNFGHQNACLAGLQEGAAWARELGAEWVGLIDSDLQDDPAHFARLMAHSHDHDVVYAVRERRDDGFLRKTLAPVFYRFLARCATFAIPANAGTFSVMRGGLASAIVGMADVDPYVPGLRAFIGHRQKGVPLARADRHKGKSHVGLIGLVLLSLRATILYTNAIHNFILYSGLILFMVSIGAAAAFFALRALAGQPMPEDWTLWFMLSATFSAHMIFLGALGHMINRVKANTSKQPAFVIMDHGQDPEARIRRETDDHI